MDPTASHAGAPEMEGRTISHYRVLRTIGSGGMGVVYEAEDLKLGRHVALKFLPENFAGNERSRRRFEQEARAASLLNHPNICTIYDIEQREGSFFIAMERLQGEGLDTLLKRGPLPLDDALQFGAEICDALESAHAARIIHRDLKPANLFITPQNHVKVLDFGLAKIIPAPETATASTVEGLTSSGSVVGTAAYMSPEQVSGMELDRRSDLFSLGATLYEMVTGQRAYQGATVALLYDSILNHTPAPPSTINALAACPLRVGLTRDSAARNAQRPSLDAAGKPPRAGSPEESPMDATALARGPQR